MNPTDRPLARRAALAMTIVGVAASVVLGGCNRTAPSGTTSETAQTATPPPPGDSTPKPIDSNAATAERGNEKTGNPGGSSQSTVGSASSGSPGYTLNAAPEGNPAAKNPAPETSTEAAKASQK